MALVIHSVQDPSDHQTPKYTAENTQIANTWRPHRKLISNSQQIVGSPFELVKSMEGKDKDPKDVISDMSTSVVTFEKLESRRHSPRIDKEEANVPVEGKITTVDGVSDETDEPNEASEEDGALDGVIVRRY
ncbi:uncharacterized protein ALTATR162_LOCUS5128 [Alternaria atra]|uniref:Uncharacterized protein n=1 Tax=Alternaria atra TaxID=119953 RepID=A0A8J2I4D1_9PLEO|nr:uncharacterized protein ALTATR162_LOCUS5128 [Alternaria atra]CAG5158533.1 unnamed protein product [Alternaria atra]